MVDTNTQVTLERDQWRDVLKVMNRGIQSLEENGYEKTAHGRMQLYDAIDEQVFDDYNPETDRKTLGDVLAHLREETGIESSVQTEETARQLAKLSD